MKQESLISLLIAAHCSLRTFRNVPKKDQAWTSIDDNVMTEIERVVEKVYPNYWKK